MMFLSKGGNNMLKKIIILLVVILVIVIGYFIISHNNVNIHEQVAQDTGLIVISKPEKSNKYYQPFKKSLENFSTSFKTNVGYDDQVALVSELQESDFIYDDIWVRDVAPVITSKMVKFKYQPQYLDKKDSKYLDNQFKKWLNRNRFTYEQSSLILDGGNVVWDKKDTVIVTERIFEDNKNLSNTQVITELKQVLAIKNVIVIPTEEGDVLSHADGMVKFVGEDILFISDFLGDDDFKKDVESIIRETLPDINIVTIKSSYTEEGQYDPDIASAKGLYINMLETKDNMYVPSFGLPSDDKQTEFIQQYTTKKVIQIPVEDISTMGGAVNCLTWYCPPEFLTNQLIKII